VWARGALNRPFRRSPARADKEKGLGRVKDTPWWMGVEGAYWRRPHGPDSSVKGHEVRPIFRSAVENYFYMVSRYERWLRLSYRYFAAPVTFLLSRQRLEGGPMTLVQHTAVRRG
jgi:hypothetical protein